MLPRVCAFWIALFSLAAPAADFAPALQWVKTTGGSGISSVAAAAADAKGNFYIVGSTTSVDFPTTAGAAQPAAGGSMLVRIALAGGAASRLFPANLPQITFAAVAPSTPGTLYASSGSQIWSSADAGATWTMTSQLAAGGAVLVLAVDPTNANTIYAGTSTAGALKSIDGGLTWAPINNGLPASPNAGIGVTGLWIDPTSPNVVFAASSSALERSADGGNTWTPVAIVNSNSLVLAFDPSAAGTLYIATYLNGATSVFKSSDSGQTFTGQTGIPGQNVAFALLVDPHHAGTLLAGTGAGIYESADSGLTWNLKIAGLTTALAADPNSSAIYANSSGYGVVKSTDGFATTTSVGPHEPGIGELLVSGQNLFEISASSTDVFAVKLDTNGNVVYSTYFGGSGADSAAALAVGSDGSIYVTGSTTSADLPVTAGAYQSALLAPATGASNFLFKLNPDGSLGWATYFAGPGSTVRSITVDSAGNPLVGGMSSGTLPTTPGAYQTSFTQSAFSNGFFAVIGPPAGFVTKFNAKATALLYSTYVSSDPQNRTVEIVSALAADAAGNAWIGVGVDTGVVPAGGSTGYANVVELNPTGSAVLASIGQLGLNSVSAIALDANSNVFVSGSYNDTSGFPATSAAFQTAPQPAIPSLEYQPVAGGGSDAFVAKFDSRLAHLLAATLLGGELIDAATSIALDSAGNVTVSGYTDSRALPTHAPFQESFSSRAGFVAGFDSNLQNLLFSTYLGDGRPFAAQSAVPDGNGNILLAGSTLTPATLFIGGDNGASYGGGGIVVANKIALQPAPAVRLDSVRNYASLLANPLAPGEPIVANGAGFGSGAQIVVDGSPLASLTATATAVVAVMPDNAITSGVHTVQVSANGTLSNPVYVPAGPASPAIYSVNGSGFGQAYILNGDGTLNSPSNPAPPGGPVTIFVAGAGQISLSSGFAVTALAPSVFIDGFYCNGVAAIAGPVNGMPGNVYQITILVPNPATLAANNPDLGNFMLPAQSSVQIVMGPLNSLNFANSQMASQGGIFINIK